MATALSGPGTIRAIERELARMRESSTGPGGLPSLRTSVMTLIAWVPAPWQNAARTTLAGLEEEHPSRTILLFPEPEAPDSLRAEVALRSFDVASRPVSCEIVSIWLGGSRTSVVASVVLPLLISDLPVFLRWRGEPLFGSTELEELTALADRLIVDSGEWGEPDRDYVKLAGLFGRVAVSDIAWARIEPWRAAIAELWPDVGRTERMRVTGPRADALLLSRWLGARLGRQVSLENERAETIARVSLDGLEALPDWRDELSASELLSVQLDLFGRDPIYEEAVCKFS